MALLIGPRVALATLSGEEEWGTLLLRSTAGGGVGNRAIPLPQPTYGARFNYAETLKRSKGLLSMRP